MDVRAAVDAIGLAVDAAGVAVIVAAIAIAGGPLRARIAQKRALWALLP